MEEFRIEDKSVSASGRGKLKYPFEKLEVGQSFLVPITVSTRSNLSCCASSYGNRNNKKFATTKEGNATRVGRIA